MKITVLCFAQTRELTGAPALAFELPEGAPLAALIAALQTGHPALAGVPLRYALNREFATADRVLREGDEVALIPPVAGG